VLDLASAHSKALQYLVDAGKSIALNLGNRKGYSVQEVIDTVKKNTKKRLEIIEVERREGDSAELVGVYSSATTVLNWKHEYNLTKIIESAWNWYS
jgi:UDP-glucose 4-epimerase